MHARIIWFGTGLDVTADGMSIGMKSPRRTVVILAALAIVVLLAWAWRDGGREPLREIAVPVAVPESAK
jgi:hypothetical protein